MLSNEGEDLVSKKENEFPSKMNIRAKDKRWE